MTTKEEVLQNCTVEGNVVKLPATQLDRKLYQEVAKSLELIGGKWKGGKVFGFIFPNDPTDLLHQIANGEKRNLKKEYQFFATPPELADYLCELAWEKKEIHYINTWDTAYRLTKVLEPSAGQGAIIDAIRRKAGLCSVHAFELMDVNREILKQKYESSEYFLLAAEKDFLNAKEETKFNWIIANPPFNKNQDVEHIKKMYNLLAESSVLVSVASEHWVNSSNKKETEFREWLKEVNAEIFDIPRGSFKESGTMVGGKIIRIVKC